MKKSTRIVVCVFVMFSMTAVISFVPGLQAAGFLQTLWNVTYGDVERDAATAVVSCADGGTAVAGYSRSWGDGETDVLVYKLNSNGERQWAKVYGVFDGVSNSMAYGIAETHDGSLVVVGEKRIYSTWDNFNLTSSYRYNVWVLKLDAHGNEIWSKTLGGTDYDRANAVVTDTDGGIIVAGHTQSFYADGSNPPAHAKKELWIIKLDKDGNVQWQKLYGAKYGSDGATALVRVQGGYVVCGFTSSYSAGGVGDYDAWIMKLDGNGNMLWSRTVGGSKFDQANAVIETSSGDILVAGESTAVSGNGSTDFFVLSYDKDGRFKWSRTYGFAGFERARAIAETPGGNFIVAGYSDSIGAGNKDAWLIKINSSGLMLSSQTIGGADCDEAFAVTRTTDGHYVVAGNTASWGAGGVDTWVVKVRDFLL